MPTRDLIAQWMFKEDWDFVVRPTWAEFEAYAHACLAGASGDGTLAPAERDWIVGYFATIGLPDEHIPEFQNAQAEVVSAALADRLTAFRATPAGQVSCRGLVYDCVRAAGADAEYHAGESSTIHQIGGLLEISDAIVDQIEDVYRREQALKAERLQLFFPAGIHFMAGASAGS